MEKKAFEILKNDVNLLSPGRNFALWKQVKYWVLVLGGISLSLFSNRKSVSVLSSLSFLFLSLSSLSLFLSLSLSHSPLSLSLSFFLYISLYLSANFNYHQPLAAPVNVLSTWCAHVLQVKGTPGFYSHALCRNKIVGLLDNCSIGFMTLSNFCSIVWLSLSSAVFGENSCRKIG